jgi:methyl-CpG-binding domain protein 4
MSPYGLLQEELGKDPWKIFVCCIFCNLTKRVQAEPYFWEILKRWPSPEELSEADIDLLAAIIKPLGLSRRRSKTLKTMSYDYIHKDWRDNPRSLYGIGKYGSDAYYIFCTEKWRDVNPKDGALVNYHTWLLSLDNLN